MTELATVQNTTPAATTPADLLKIAVESNADIDKLEKLMALQERWEANEAKKAYVQAVSNFRESAPIIKKGRNGHNSKYAGLPETIAAIQEQLTANGLSFAWETSQDGNLVTVGCRLTHIQGHSEVTSLSSGPDTSGSKNSIQAIGSTVTYLQRYTLYSMLGLASTDQDDDGNGASLEYVSEEQAANIDCLISEIGVNKAQFLKYMKTDGVDHIQSCDYERAVRVLEKKRKS